MKPIYQIRSFEPSMLDSAVHLNNSQVPKVNALTAEELEQLITWSRYCWVVLCSDQLVALLVVLPPKLPYKSENYLWFSQRYETFEYVDRIVVDSSHIGFGIGSALYRHLETSVDEQAQYIACEVNVKPKNEGSLLFHRNQGFVSVGRQQTENNTKEVELFVKKLQVSSL